jgi:hypothetical protein
MLSNRAKDNLALAKKRQEEYTNRERRELIFKEGDRVLLSAKHIILASQVKRPSKKLQPRFIGPYRIEKVVSPVAYRLTLPATVRIHPVFHVSLLRKYEEPTDIPLRPNPVDPPPAITTGENEEFEVERILDERWHRQRREYLVQWKGYPEYDAGWEPEPNLENAKEALAEFRERQRTTESSVEIDGVEGTSEEGWEVEVGLEGGWASAESEEWEWRKEESACGDCENKDAGNVVIDCAGSRTSSVGGDGVTIL